MIWNFFKELQSDGLAPVAAASFFIFSKDTAKTGLDFV
jgi:hypothetical protein